MMSITGAQIRAARAVLRWSAETLSKRAKVGIQTVKRLEAVDSVSGSRQSTLQQVQAALEAAGIEFIGSPTDRPGIRLVKQPSIPTGNKRRQRA